MKNDSVNQIQHFEIRFLTYDTNNTIIRERTFPLDTRYTFRYELHLLFESASFEIIDIFRDSDKNTFDGTGELIMVGRAIA